MADDLFRFLQVRPVRRIRGEQNLRVIRYPFFGDSPQDIAEAEEAGEPPREHSPPGLGAAVAEGRQPPISGNLVQAIGRDPSQAEVEEALAAWTGRERAEATMPRLQRLADKLGALAAGEPTELTLLVEREVISLAYFAWDLLLIAYREHDARRKEILAAAVRYLWALHALGFPDEPPAASAFAPWFNATVAVPPWFVPPNAMSPLAAASAPSTPAPDTSRLRRLTRARAKLDDALQSPKEKDGDTPIDERARRLAQEAGVEVGADDDLVAVEAALADARRMVYLNIQPVTRPEDQVVVLGNKALPLDQVCAPRAEIDPCAEIEQLPWPGTFRKLVPVGVGDMMVVRRRVERYEMGLVADIESVPPGHKKVRTHRSLERSESETELTSSTETSREQEHQVEENEKLSLASRREQERQNETKAGIELSASYGTVKLSASASYASQSSKKVSDESAREYAKQVTSSALEKVREERSSRSLQRQLREVEETNVDSLENDGDAPRNAIYRWVDRHDTAEMVNVGRRLIYEASIPEPAAFYIYSQIVDASRDAVVEMPVAPHETEPVLGLALTGPQDLDDQNYVLWARLYGATGLEPPPPRLVDISAGANGSGGEDIWRTESLRATIPPGYEARHARGTVQFSGGGDNYMNLIVGNHHLPGDENQSRTDDIALDGISGDCPLAIQGRFSYFVVHVKLTCTRTPAAFAAWQAATYDKLLIAYQQRLEAAESELERLRARGGVADIRGLHPEENRRIVRTELKKSFLELLTGQRFASFDAMKSNVGALRYPEFDFEQAEEEGRIIDFFERAFEWSEATFAFREYFTGRKRGWVSMVNLQDPDPLFAEFLRAGKARYAVPVTPGFENAVAHYVTSGEVFLGGDLPTIDDELYLSVAEELQGRDAPADGDIVASWPIKVPTSLVMIDPSGQLPSF